MAFNVDYDAPRGTQRYLALNAATRAEAEVYVKDFQRLYVGKPYPNGKGWYPFTNPRVVEVSA